MRNPILSFIMEIIGAFIVWTLKGFKGSLAGEMSRPYESSNKSLRNALVSIVFIAVVLLVVSKFKQHQKATTNTIRIIHLTK